MRSLISVDISTVMVRIKSVYWWCSLLLNGYSVSNLSTVWSICRGVGHVTHTNPIRSGYLRLIKPFVHTVSENFLRNIKLCLMNDLFKRLYTAIYHNDNDCLICRSSRILLRRSSRSRVTKIVSVQWENRLQKDMKCVVYLHWLK